VLLRIASARGLPESYRVWYTALCFKCAHRLCNFLKGRNATREKTGKSSGIWTISLEIFRCKIVESFFKANRKGSLESVSIERPEAVAWMLIYRGLELRSKLPGEQILLNSQQLVSWWFVLPLPSTSS
jgi:hypothetical protein